MELPPAHAISNQRPHVSPPAHIAAFSYSEKRELLLDDNKNASLQFYRDPVIPADLNQGFQSCTWRDQSQLEGLDSLLAWFGRKSNPFILHSKSFLEQFTHFT